MGWFSAKKKPAEQFKPARTPPKTPEVRPPEEPTSPNAWYDELQQQSHLDSTYGEYESCSDDGTATIGEVTPATSPRGFFDSTTHTPEATPRRRKRTQDKERNYWSRREAVPDDPPRGSILCKARARRAFEAVEPAELNVEDNQEVLVLREELGPLSEGQRSRPTTPGWVFAVSDQNSGYVPRTYLEAEEDITRDTIRYVSKAERNTAEYNAAAVGQTTQGDYWVQKMAAELDSSDALDVPARPPPPSFPAKIDPVTPAQVEKMTAPKLKKALKERGLSTQGLKGELKARLLEALRTSTPSRGLVTQADKPKPVVKSEEPDLLAQLLAKEEKPADHLEQVTRKPMERRRPSVENNSTYQTVLEMCLAGDAGEPEDAKTFAAEFRKKLGISDAAHRIILARLKPNAVWKVALAVEPMSQQASGRAGRQGEWLAERRRRSFELDNTKALMLAASQGNHLGQIRAALAEGERLGLVGFASFECIEAEACLAARYAAEAQERLDDLERAHKDKFAFDYGRRDDLAALTMQARANEAKVKAYSEDVPPPEPAPLGDGWSSESEEELIEMPDIQEIVDNESLQEALRRKRLEYVRRCRTDVAFLEELDDCVQDRLDDFGDERGHDIEAEVSFSNRLLDVFRAPRIKFVRNGTDLKLEAKSILREEVAPALYAADAECAHRNLALRATVNVYVRRRGDLTSRKQAQAEALAKRRAEVVIEELVAHGVRRSCLEGVAGGADDTAGVDFDLGFYDEEPQREELSIVLVEKGDDESSVTSPWRPGDPRAQALVRSSFDEGSVLSRSSYGTRVSWESHSSPPKLLPPIC